MNKIILGPVIIILAILALGCVYKGGLDSVKVSPEPTNPECINQGDGCRFEWDKPSAEYEKYGQNTIWNSTDICNSRCVVKNDKCVQDTIYQASCMNCLEKCSAKNAGNFDKLSSCQEKCVRD